MHLLPVKFIQTCGKIQRSYLLPKLATDQCRCHLYHLKFARKQLLSNLCLIFYYTIVSQKIKVEMWHSTETALINITDVILKAMNNKQLTAVVLLDMSKAFDSLDHGILISKLEDVGASNTALK